MLNQRRRQGFMLIDAVVALMVTSVTLMTFGTALIQVHQRSRHELDRLTSLRHQRDQRLLQRQEVTHATSRHHVN